jgi:hypothetical protein
MAALVALGIVTICELAAADVAPPDPVCSEANAGAPCTMGDGGTGVCGITTCYAHGGAVPCFRCVEPPARASDAGPDAAPASDAGPNAGGGSAGCAMARTGSVAAAFGIAACVPLLVRRRRRA